MKIMNKFYFLLILITLYVIKTEAQCVLSGDIKPTDTQCGSCNGGINLTVVGTQPPYTYYWTKDGDFFASTEDLTGLCAATYNITITDAVNCTWSGSQIISEDVTSGSAWPKITNTSGNEEVCDMATNPNTGNVYVIGYYDGTIDFGVNTGGSHTITVGKGIYIVEYDYCGEIVYGRVYGKVGVPDIPDLHIEFLSNRLIVAGEFAAVNFTNNSANEMVSSGGSYDVFLATLDMSTLLCNANQQISISSTGGDELVRGISSKGNAIYIAGSFSGTTLSFSNSTTTLTKSGGSQDLFICKFIYTLGSMYWAQNYSGTYNEEGFTLQAINSNSTPFFTYMESDINLAWHSYIVRLNSSTGAIVSSAQIGLSDQYYVINDMINSGNSLYLCGYYKANNTTTIKQAAILYYATPLTSLTSYTSLVSQSTTGSECQATKLVVNTNGVYVSGTYNLNQFNFANTLRRIEYVYGTTNHYVYKTDNTLSPTAANGWISGVISSLGTSRGNTLVYGTNNMYYLGGAINNTTVLTGTAMQSITPFPGGFDGFIGRFQDNGSANYLRLASNKPNEEKIENTSFTLYPNPTNSKVVIKINNGEAIRKITVNDVTGRVVYENSFSGVVYQTEPDLSFLLPDTYVVNITTANNNYNTKLAIVK
jgi:hypothetical protein